MNSGSRDGNRVAELWYAAAFGYSGRVYFPTPVDHCVPLSGMHPVALAEDKTGGGANRDVGALLEPVRTALARVGESERYRLLASFFEGLADSRPAVSGEGDRQQSEVLAKKLARLAEEKALADDALAAARADLEHRAKQLEAERQRADEMERIATDQRGRLRTAQGQVAELEDQIVAKNRQLHEIESRVEELTVRVQRAELAAGDTSKVESLEEGKRNLSVEVEQLRGQLERLRRDKDAVIEQLKTDVRGAQGAANAGADELLVGLWERLAKAKLVPGNQKPPAQASERLVDAFIELGRFVEDLDQAVVPFLSSFTRHNQAVARPWEVYAKQPSLQQVLGEIVDAEHGKPAGVVKMRLLGLKRWVLAAIIGGDSAIESIASELETYLRGDLGLGADPNRKIKDFLRDDGQELFHQHIRELRSQKLADVYAQGV